MRGTVLRADSAGLLLQPRAGGQPVAAPLASLEHVQLFQGKGDTTTGTLLGGMIGAVAGYTAIYESVGSGDDMRHEESILLGAAPGALIGALIGALSAEEHWRAVRVVP